jgi:hypothetical protein
MGEVGAGDMTTIRYSMEGGGWAGVCKKEKIEGKMSRKTGKHEKRMENENTNKTLKNFAKMV